MGYIDLHVHSSISDGTLTPTELVAYAYEHGIEYFALTDHDSIFGVAEAMRETAKLREHGKSIYCIPGIEISAAYKSRDIHILGYYLDTTDTSLQRSLKTAISERNARNERMAARFRDAGIPITVDKLRQYKSSEPDSDETITRAHFARYLIEHGYAKNNTDAFDHFLGHSCRFFVPREYIQPEEAIKLIRSAGGVAVLAHPLLYDLSAGELEELIMQLKTAGLDGIEVYYSSNVSNDEDTVRRYANRYNLIMTGGSDFHGSNKPQLEIGTGRGNLCVPYSCLEALRERHLSR